MLNESSIKEWHVKDVIILLLFLTLFQLIIYSIVDSFSFTHRGIAASLSLLFASLLVILLFTETYPLQLTFNIKYILMYSQSALLICILIYSPFYYSVYTGKLDDLPYHYELFLKLNLLEKSYFLVYFSLLGPITEEIIFRGLIYRILRNKYNVVIGGIISTILFVAIHNITSNEIISTVVTLGLVSLIFTYVYEKSGSIWSSIVTHSLNNIVWFLFVYLGLRNSI